MQFYVQIISANDSEEPAVWAVGSVTTAVDVATEVMHRGAAAAWVMDEEGHEIFDAGSVPVGNRMVEANSIAQFC